MPPYKGHNLCLQHLEAGQGYRDKDGTPVENNEITGNEENAKWKERVEFCKRLLVCIDSHRCLPDSSLSLVGLWC